MKYNVVISSDAENDLVQSFNWYEDKRIGLGYDFILQVDASINFIKRNPEINSIEYKGVRKHLVKRFPYKIIYLINKEKIIVLAVIHSKRNPVLIKDRITNN